MLLFLHTVRLVCIIGLSIGIFDLFSFFSNGMKETLLLVLGLLNVYIWSSNYLRIGTAIEALKNEDKDSEQ